MRAGQSVGSCAWRGPGLFHAGPRAVFQDPRDACAHTLYWPSADYFLIRDSKRQNSVAVLCGNSDVSVVSVELRL